MRPDHLTLVSAVLLALVATIALRDSVAVGGIAQPRESPREIRMGTVDIYLISERIMEQPTLMRAREQAGERHAGRLSDIEDDLRQLEIRLQGLRENDPQVEQIMERAQTLQAEYQRLHQERHSELERINSRQLIEAFSQIRDGAALVARREGYTHILSSRAFGRAIETETVGSTLQELLARPLLVGPEADDLTQKILNDLDLDPPAEPADGGATIMPRTPDSPR